MAPPIVTATLQATALAALSNVSAQLITGYRNEIPLTLSVPELARFVSLALATAPFNFQWQAFLERQFPARPVSAETEALARAERGEQLSREQSEKQKYRDDPTGATADKEEHAEHHGEKHDKYAATTAAESAPFSFRNTVIKWFVDCITIGCLMNTLGFLLLVGALKGKSVAELVESVRKDTIPLMVASYKLWPLASVISFTLIPVEKRIVFLSLVGLCWGVYLSMVASVV